MKAPGKNAPLHKHVEWFVRWHLGKDAFAPHTGQDLPAWIAFVYLVECWTRGGGNSAVVAMQSTVRCAQQSRAVLETFVQAIPAVGDWMHVAELWPEVAGVGIVTGGLVIPTEPSFDVRELYATERWGEIRDGKNVASEQITKHGWSRYRTPGLERRIATGLP